MAHTEQHHYDAAAAMDRGALSATFSQALTRSSKIALFEENAQLLAGDSGAIAGKIERGKAVSAKAIQGAKGKEAERAKRSFDTVLYLDLLDNHIADLERRMGKLETQLIDRFGEDWSQQVALEVLDPDDMPQRRDGESMTDYKERVERAFVEEMLDDNGNVKAEYKDHSRYGQAAQWAKYRHDSESATSLRKKLSDPDLTVTEAEAIVESTPSAPTIDQLEKAKDGLASDSGGRQALFNEVDNQFDVEVGSKPVHGEDSAFLSNSMG